LYGATALSNEANIRHRIDYATAFSLLTYDVLTEEITFNAVDERSQMTGQALGARHVVRPASLFPSIVTLRSVTQRELVLAIKTLLSTKNYGAETRIGGDCRNTVIGIVAGWEEIITPLELTLELYDTRETLERDPLAELLQREYRSRAGSPSKVRILSSKEIDEVVSECAAVDLNSEFLSGAYKDVKDYRAAQAS